MADLTPPTPVAPTPKRKLFSFLRRKEKIDQGPPSRGASLSTAWRLLRPYWTARDDNWALTEVPIGIPYWWKGWHVKKTPIPYWWGGWKKFERLPLQWQMPVPALQRVELHRNDPLPPGAQPRKPRVEHRLVFKKRLMRPFSGKWWTLGTVVALTLSQVAISVWFTNWNNGFYNALQAYDGTAAGAFLAQFCGMALVSLGVSVMTTYLQQKLQMRWRQWMTKSYIGKWLGNKAHFRLQQNAAPQQPGVQPRPGQTDNPDQRISEDIDSATNGTLNLGLGLINNVVTLASYTTMLWSLSGPLAMTVAGHALTLPGYMLWAALGYAGIGTWITHKIGRPLISLKRQKQRLEADFRYNLVRTRINAKEIAQTNGEPVEKKVLEKRFDFVARNWDDIRKSWAKISGFNNVYNQLAVIFPFFVAMPRYFAKKIALGGLMQVASAFGQVQTAVSWIANSYTDIADWKSCVDRLDGFGKGIEAAEKAAMNGPSVKLAPQPAPSLSVSDLVISRPHHETGQNDPLIEKPFSVALNPGDRMIISGPSGCGKSTMLLAMQGLWPRGDGQIEWPENARIICVPQRPYLPNLPLAEILAYPQPLPAIDDAQLQQMEAALREVGLEKLIPALKTGAPDGDQLSKQLSGGEQQKVAFARVLLQKPDIILLDEATASLDPASNDKLYGLLIDRLPKATIISVAHREDVRKFHTLHATLEGRVVSVHAIPPAPPPGPAKPDAPLPPAPPAPNASTPAP